MRGKAATVFMILIVTTFVTAVLAQGRGPGQGVPLYDPKTEVTLTGSVNDVLQQPCCSGRRTGTHLVIQTQSETVEVSLGPTSYVEQKGFSFTKGDQVEVIGSRVKLSGKDAIIARQVTKDKQTLTLRNAQGFPEWSGGRRGN